jgi:hypothetical protein
MKYHIETECVPTTNRYAPTICAREVAVFGNGTRKEIEWIYSLPEGKTLRDVMTLKR